MQIRCQNCHKPFAIGKDAARQALETIEAEGQAHFNVDCPHCRRANKISRAELERAVPDWRSQKPEAG